MKRYFPGTTLRQYWWEAAYLHVRRALARWLYRPQEYKPENWVSYRFNYGVSGSPTFRNIRPGAKK